MNIREQRPGDIGWIISVHGEVYAREFSFDGSFEFNIAAKLVDYFAADDGFNRIWIAEVDGERAGSIAVRPIGEDIAFIHFVVVLDRFRGEGIARALMDRVSQHAAAHGRKRLRLETFTCLENARQLYGSLGFGVVESSPVEDFGRALTREFWELDLV